MRNRRLRNVAPRGRRALLPLIILVLLLSACGNQPSVTAPQASTVYTPAPTPVPVRDLHDWLTFDYSASRSGVNPYESSITPANVATLHRLWSVQLPGVADSSPVYLHAVKMPDGSTRDVIYVTTRDGGIAALDAASGALIWSRRPAGQRITHSSPSIGPNRKYIYAYGLDGYLHRYNPATGVESRENGWPVQITRMPGSEKESSAVNIDNEHVYVTTSGYIGDHPPYQGHVVTIPTSGGDAHVFNSLCSEVTHLLAQTECASQQSGIWARAGTVVDPRTGNIFTTTGNGPFDGRQDWGDSALELSPNGERLLDSYTPRDQAQLNANDTDLGSTAPALLPPLPASKTPDLLVQGGKDATFRLLNRQNLSGQGGPGHLGGALQTIATPGHCAIVTQPAVWQNPANKSVWLFASDYCAMGGYKVVTDGQGRTRLQLEWTRKVTTSSPVVADGVLFAASSGAVLAVDPASGNILWSSADQHAGGTIGAIHWESPIVINGHVYCSDESGHLTAYGL